MHFLHILQLLALLTLANGTPIVAKKIFGPRFARPLDGGIIFFDGRPLFGHSKTIRGITASILITMVSAPLIGLDLTIVRVSLDLNFLLSDSSLAVGPAPVITACASARSLDKAYCSTVSALELCGSIDVISQSSVSGGTQWR